MTDWEWESFDSFTNDGRFSVTQAGPLHVPIHSVSITRDEQLQLVLETMAAHNAQANATIHPAKPMPWIINTVNSGRPDAVAKDCASGVNSARGRPP
jgi:hypothetical protein